MCMIWVGKDIVDEGNNIINSGKTVTHKWASMTVLIFHSDWFWLHVTVYMYNIGYCLLLDYLETSMATV